jgi:hypothetical protein
VQQLQTPSIGAASLDSIVTLLLTGILCVSL